MCERAVRSSSFTLELHFSSDLCPCSCLSYVVAMSIYPVNLHLTSWHNLGSYHYYGLVWPSVSLGCPGYCFTGPDPDPDLLTWFSYLNWDLSYCHGLAWWICRHYGPLADRGYCHSACFADLAQVLWDSTLGNDVTACACLAVPLWSNSPFPKDLLLWFFSQHKNNAFISSFLWWMSILWNNLILSFNAVSSLAHYCIQVYFWTFTSLTEKPSVFSCLVAAMRKYEP